MYGKHQTKHKKFLVCQQGRIGAEIWTPGPMASIRLKGKNSWYANSVQAPSFSLYDTGRPQRAQKQGQKRSVVDASGPVSYPHDNEWLQDRHVITFLAERAYLNVVDEPLAWNYLVRAIMRHRKMTGVSARKSDWL